MEKGPPYDPFIRQWAEALRQHNTTFVGINGEDAVAVRIINDPSAANDTPFNEQA